MLPRILLHWWATYSQIVVGPSNCPAGPDGQVQSASAVIALGDWLPLFNLGLALTAIVSLLLVIATYQTRLMGSEFSRRWRRWLLGTAIAVGIMVFAVVASPDVQTIGCQYGNQTTRVPFGPALNRATVAFVQGLLFFLLWSILLTRLARVTQHQPWFNNSRFPV